MKSSLHLVRYFINHGRTISVFDGEEWPTKKSADEAAIMADIESVDEPQLHIHDENGAPIAWVMVVNGLADDELVADYSANGIMAAWNSAYEMEHPQS